MYWDTYTLNRYSTLQPKSPIASVKKNPPWHILMTYQVSSGYVMKVCRHDISNFDMSWERPASQQLMTHNDICNDTCWWHVLMTGTSMTYRMTYGFDSTPQGHQRITYQKRWKSYVMGYVMTTYVMRYVIVICHDVYVMRYVIVICHDNICHVMCHRDMSWDMSS